MNEVNNPVLLASIHSTAERCQNEGFGIGERTLRTWISEGLLAYVPSGNRKLIYWPTLLDFLAKGQTVDNTPRPRYGRGSRGGRRY